MRKPVLVLSAAALLITAGCAGNDSGPGGPSAARPKAPRPTGAPIVLGLTSQEGGSSMGNWPELRHAAEAAVTYVNSELGGVYGRPLELETCITNGSPEGSIKCANTIVSKRPFLVIGGMEVAGDASMPIYTAAKLPYLGGAPINAAQLSAPNSVQWNGFSIGGLPAMAAYAAEVLHARNVVIVYPDVPGTENFIGALMKPVLQAKGVTGIKMLGADVKQPDKTTTVGAAAQFNPDAIIAIDAGGGCVSFLKAHADLASDTPLLITGNCVDARLRKAAGSAAEGVYTTEGTLVRSDPNHPDVQVFQHALSAYAPRDIAVTEVTAAGFNTVMNVYSALKSLPADQRTPGKVLQTLKSAKNVSNFMGHPFTCDGRVKSAPSVCNTAVRMIQVRNGELVDVGGGWFDAAQFVH